MFLLQRVIAFLVVFILAHGAVAAGPYLLQSLDDVDQFVLVPDKEKMSLVVSVFFKCTDCFQKTLEKVRPLLKNDSADLNVQLVVVTNWEKARGLLMANHFVKPEDRRYFYNQGSVKIAFDLGLSESQGGYALISKHGTVLLTGTTDQGINIGAIRRFIEQQKKNKQRP